MPRPGFQMIEGQFVQSEWDATVMTDEALTVVQSDPLGTYLHPLKEMLAALSKWCALDVPARLQTAVEGCVLSRRAMLTWLGHSE